MNTRETELFHYGIKGMHWGVRRYQNVDGSYTAAGAARYNKAKSTYDTAKAGYKSGNLSKEKYTEAKNTYKAEKQKYKQDIKADRGDELTQNGHGKGMVVAKGVGKNVAVSTATNLVNKVSKNKISGLTNTVATAANVQNLLDTVYDWQAINLSRSRKASKAS